MGALCGAQQAAGHLHLHTLVFTSGCEQLASHDVSRTALLITDPDPRVYPDSYCPQMAHVLALLRPAPLSVSCPLSLASGS